MTQWSQIILDAVVVKIQILTNAISHKLLADITPFFQKMFGDFRLYAHMPSSVQSTNICTGHILTRL